MTDWIAAQIAAKMYPIEPDPFDTPPVRYVIIVHWPAGDDIVRSPQMGGGSYSRDVVFYDTEDEAMEMARKMRFAYSDPDVSPQEWSVPCSVAKVQVTQKVNVEHSEES